MEDDTVTLVEVSSSLVAMVRLSWFHRGCELWYVSREAHLNAGDPVASRNGVPLQLTEARHIGYGESDQSYYSETVRPITWGRN